MAFILDPEKSYRPRYIVEHSCIPQGARRRVQKMAARQREKKDK
jgi:hypothetical protein